MKTSMMRHLFWAVLLLEVLLLRAVEAFAQPLPQEKVFVHLDNTCYCLGDTIWYAAYTRQTDRDIPSSISQVLYVELLNQDGFLVERQTIKMNQGRGHGCFSLADTTLYAGFYELRAYTRWQLNWGRAERKHTSEAEAWFFNQQTVSDFYRDYDKLYSRVFPVYNVPKGGSEFHHEMTSRPLRRYFKDKGESPSLRLSLFPEGGTLVAGLPCRVAFEAATEEGEALEGTLQLYGLEGERLVMQDDEGTDITTVVTESRGRGTFVITPRHEDFFEAVFTAHDGRVVKKELNPAEEEGVVIRMRRSDDVWEAQVSVSPLSHTRPFAVSVMHEGQEMLTREMRKDTAMLYLPSSRLPDGVCQITVHDVSGRVYADRLFFNLTQGLMRPSLSISEVEASYEPYECVKLGIQGKANATLSVSVRDAATSDATFDSANILTEMLLASEIKGFVPHPDWFFESDDEEHRRGLDLLMMTQGWRRFSWHETFMPQSFIPQEPAEQTPTLIGEIYPFAARWRQDETMTFDSIQMTYTPWDIMQAIHERTSQEMKDLVDSTRHGPVRYPMYDQFYDRGWGEIIEALLSEMKGKETGMPVGSYRLTGDIARSRFLQDRQRAMDTLRVHAEFVQPESNRIIQIDTITTDGTFEIHTPDMEGGYILFLSASDSSQWKVDKFRSKPHQSSTHRWISPNGDFPEFYVRLREPYPRFVKPYNYYQTHLKESRVNSSEPVATSDEVFLFDTQMEPLTLGARHGGLRGFDASSPAYVMDAYEAFNAVTDAGLCAGWYEGRTSFMHSLARLYVGDMESSQDYALEPRYDSHTLSYTTSPIQLNLYNDIANLNEVRLYTDFSPRNPDKRLTEDNVGNVSIDLRLLPNQGQRYIYRDRRYVKSGFAVCQDFYHPDYHLTPSQKGQLDYRRTLYWNPELLLDGQGQAHVSFFTGNHQTHIIVEANGQATDGALLTGLRK